LFKVPSKVKYALIALIHIMKNSKNIPIPLSEILKKSHLSKTYMERVLAELVKNNILKSIRDKKGGFALKTKRDNISLYTIFRIFVKEENYTHIKTKIKKTNDDIFINNISTTLNKKFIQTLKDIKLIEIIKLNNKKK